MSDNQRQDTKRSARGLRDSKWAAVVAFITAVWPGAASAHAAPEANQGPAAKAARGAQRSSPASNRAVPAGAAPAKAAAKASAARRGAPGGERNQAASEASRHRAGGGSVHPRLDKRVDALERRARKLRESGKQEQAARLEKQAQLLAKHPRPARARAAGQEGAHEARLRKRAKVERWHRRYGAALRRPDVQAELRLHGLRSAKLRRMNDLAQQKTDPQQRAKLLERIEKLETLEAARHERALSRLAGAAAVGDKQTPRAAAAPERNAPPGKARAPAGAATPHQAPREEVSR